MPAPYPATPEQRVAAAKKYGLREEDYEPYPDDGFGYGDYPMLPAISTDSRSYHDTWDDPSNRRNYGEPVSKFLILPHDMLIILLIMRQKP